MTWQLDAACAGTDPELFFPQTGGTPWPAKAICRRCPVIDACLSWALENRPDGVWGATTEHERDVILDRRMPRPMDPARRWAITHGIDVNMQGRVRDSVRAAYEAAIAERLEGTA